MAERPEIPAALIDALQGKRCVLFAGGGVAMANGYPSFFQLMSTLVESHADAELLPSFKAEIVAEALAEQFGEKLPKLVNSAYQRNLEGPPSHFLTQLAQLPFAGLLLANWDSILEKLLQIPPANCRTLDDLERIESGPFSIKIWGDLNRPETVLFTGTDLAKRLRHPFVQRYFSTLLASHSLLFVGASLETVQEFFDIISGSAGTMPHFALLPVEDEKSDRYLRGFLLKRYGVHLIGFLPFSHPAVLDYFATQLVEQLAGSQPALSQVEPQTPTNGVTEPVILKSVKLQNIGPFSSLNLDFEPGWNLLLGNNGCGKSTVLRAIAHALASDEPDAQSSLATRGLLRVGARSGKVELVGERLKWTTEYLREGDLTLTFSQPRQPFQKGHSVVLGFPALRGISSANPRGPMADGPGSPQVADLLPLIQASADFRLDSSKQWIVNAWARQKHSLLAKYFEVLRDLTPGVDFELSRVDTDSWNVLVNTPDGEIPLDHLSQGTSSIISWVGVLLERLYEMHPKVEDPTQEPALVLIDEIDAHMHPDWQQTMVPLIRKHFPKLQVIASTHSPLLLGSFEANEVYHFQRNPETRQIEVERLETSFLGWRADQILTGPAFGLDSTISQDAESWLAEYTTLTAKADPSPQDSARIAELKSLIQQKVPTSPETPAQREALEALNEFLVRRLLDRPAEEKRRIMEEAKKLVLEIQETP